MTSSILVVHNIPLEDGETLAQKNARIPHEIPLFTLVEVNINYSDEHGLRLYVQGHSRDCDGTPLYDLTFDANLIGKDIDTPPLSRHPLDMHVHAMDKGKVTRHFSKDSLIIIESAESVRARLNRQ